jgi:hypothetical protein
MKRKVLRFLIWFVGVFIMANIQVLLDRFEIRYGALESIVIFGLPLAVIIFFDKMIVRKWPTTKEQQQNAVPRHDPYVGQYSKDRANQKRIEHKKFGIRYYTYEDIADG